MLPRKFAGCIFVLSAIAISSAQSAVVPQQTLGNSQTPNAQNSPRLAPGPVQQQQQPAWRPGQQVQAKPSPRVVQPQAASNSVEPTTGASITWPGTVNQPHVTLPHPAAAAVAVARPVNAMAPAHPASTLNAGMPMAQPLTGSAGRAGVEYRGGLLSVVAENAELGKLMRLVGTRTGAQIDVAADVANELVMAHLGPASPNEVLTALLDSSHLTYIMIGEDKVSKVVIRRRYGSATPPVVARHRNLGFPEPGAEAQANTQPEQTAQSDQVKPAGEVAPPAIQSRSPLMRSASRQPVQSGQAQVPDENNQGSPIENVDVRGQVSGTEAPEQAESNPPQQ
jgi:hypothetical protein